MPEPAKPLVIWQRLKQDEICYCEKSMNPGQITGGGSVDQTLYRLSNRRMAIHHEKHIYMIIISILNARSLFDGGSLKDISSS